MPADEPEPRPRRSRQEERRPRGKSSKVFWVVVVGGVLLLVGGAVAAFVLLGSGSGGSGLRPQLPEALEIRLAPVDRETRYRLPEPATAMRLGGGGRFLILAFRKGKSLGIFDVNEAKIVRTVAVGEEDFQFAAGMNHLMVYLPKAHTLQRYNLLTGEREASRHLDDLPADKIDDFCMGHASAGPLLICTALSNDRTRRGEGHLFDARSLTLMSVPVVNHGNPRVVTIDGGRFWAGATGRVFGHTHKTGSPSGAKSLVMTANGLVEIYEHEDIWSILPGPDDRHFFASDVGVVNDHLVQAAEAPGKQRGHIRPLYAPAAHGPYYLHTIAADNLNDPRAKDLPSLPVQISIHVLGEKNPIASITAPGLMRVADRDDLRRCGIEYTVQLIPRAKLLAVLPDGGEFLWLAPMDVDAALEKLSWDYLIFTSMPGSSFQKGTTYSYAATRAKRGPVTYRLEDAPAGMSVSPDGQVTWSVPSDFTETRVVVRLVARDAAGKETVQILSPASGQ
jgi:hypothetical protein